MKTPALVTALVLALALGGGAGYAAGKLPAHSVGAKQLQKGAVTKAKIKRGAVTGVAVADGSLTAADLAPGTLPPAVRPGTVRTLGSEFRPTSSSDVYHLVNFGGLYLDSPAFVQTSVALPPGASVRAVRVRVHDNGASDVLAFARRLDMVTQASADGPNAITTGAPGGATLTLTVPGSVSASDSLQVFVLLPASGQYAVYGVDVDYA
jgi:hypothetical protein